MADTTIGGEAIRARIPYQAIVDRPKLKLPGGARVALWTIVNVENWNADAPQPRMVLPPPMGQPMLPDVPNWSWHEYGMRVGFWRFMDVLGARNIRPTLAINGTALTLYEKACIAARDAGWEFLGHGYEQKPMHKVDDERTAIRQTVEAIRALTGAPPRGWESPGMTETQETLDLLAEAGIEYTCDYSMDDLPVPMTSKHGPMLSLPYPVEVNDVAISAVARLPSDAIFTRGRDTFDRLYKEGADIPRIMAVSIHPYLTGVPHRIRYLEDLYDYVLGHDDVAVMTGAEIVDWFNGEMAGQGA